MTFPARILQINSNQGPLTTYFFNQPLALADGAISICVVLNTITQATGVYQNLLQADGRRGEKTVSIRTFSPLLITPQMLPHVVLMSSFRWPNDKSSLAPFTTVSQVIASGQPKYYLSDETF